MEIIIVGWDLGVGAIVCEFKAMGECAGRGIMAPGFPKAEMLQNLLDNRPVLNHADDLHFALALGTYQGINLVDFLD